MLREWHHLLEAESRQCKGQALPPLQAMHWRLGTVARLAYLANERGQGELSNILKCLCNHYGDTALIENVHKEAKEPCHQLSTLFCMYCHWYGPQSRALFSCHLMPAKDSLRSSRHFQKSRVGKMSTVQLALWFHDSLELLLHGLSWQVDTPSGKLWGLKRDTKHACCHLSSM